MQSFAPKAIGLPWLTVSIATVSVVLWITWHVFIYPYFRSPMRHLPEPPAKSAVLGHAPEILSRPLGATFRHWANVVPNDGLIKYRFLFNQERLLVTKPEILHELLVTRCYSFVKSPLVRNILLELLGPGLLVAEGEQHKIQRKNLLPAFSTRYIKRLYPTFRDKSLECIQTIQQDLLSKPKGSSDESVVEAMDYTFRATLDIIGTAGLGRDFGALKDPDNRLSRSYRAMFAPVDPKGGSVWPFITSLPGVKQLAACIPTQEGKKARTARAFVLDTCSDLIATQRKRVEAGGELGKDIISIAMSSGAFSDEELKDQMMTFLGAGHETVATSMSWAIYALCKRQDVQTRLREECHEQVPWIRDPSSTDHSVTSIDACTYLHAVCNEVLRLYPPVPWTMRTAIVDTTLGGTFVPKGTVVMPWPTVINQNTGLWGEDASEFKPERWLKDGTAPSGVVPKNQSKYSNMTFVHGPHNCIGQEFAKAELAFLLATWVASFRFELADKDWVPDMTLQAGVTQPPTTKGLYVRLL